MAKNTVVLLTLWLVCVLFSAGDRYAQAVELTVGNTFGVPGQAIDVSIIIDNATDVVSADVTVHYSSQVLTPGGAKTTALTEGFLLAESTGSGSRSISLAGSTALKAGKGSMVTLSFTISEDAVNGPHSISITEAKLYGSDMQQKPVRMSSGTVQVGFGGGEACAAEYLLGRNDSQLDTLRQFRDTVLVKNSAGRKIIALYYKSSQYIIASCKKYPAVKTAAQKALEFIVFLIKHGTTCRKSY